MSSNNDDDDDDDWTTDRKFWEDLSDKFQRRAAIEVSSISESNISEEAANLFRQIPFPKTLQDQRKILTQLIASTGTDVKRNKRDLFGDGDQSPIKKERLAQVFRNIWTEGADISLHLQAKAFTPFATACIKGDKGKVERMLKNAPTNEERTMMLERRESSFRATPLILTMGLAKHPHVVTAYTGATRMDHVGVARVLLKYGARPNVKDVAGKTAAHWGAGSVNNATTLIIAGDCIQATKTSRYFGKKVTLHGLSTEKYNGLTGILGGFVAEKERRVVHVELEDGVVKELALLPKNIMYKQKPILDNASVTNLVDVPDRLGSVALHEVVMTGNEETARFLCETHNASVDVQELNGTTPRQMVSANLGGMGGAVIDIVKARAFRKQAQQRQCGTCQAKEQRTGLAGSKKFNRCSRCGDAWYCSRDCQVAHWPQHMGQCKPKGVKLARPPKNIQNVFIANRTGASVGGGAYSQPTGTALNEKFWIKVQCIDAQSHQLVYDQTRTCSFSIEPDAPGFEDLLKKVQAEKRSLGRKTHFKAMFDSDGDCIVYPHTAKLQEW